MVSVSSEPLLPGSSVKLLIAGGFGVGKTTMVAAISEIPPLRTEEVITEMSRGVDDLVGVNCFDDSPQHDAEAVRDALDLDSWVPIVMCDVRDRASCKQVLIALAEHALSIAGALSRR